MSLPTLPFSHPLDPLHTPVDLLADPQDSPQSPDETFGFPGGPRIRQAAMRAEVTRIGGEYGSKAKGQGESTRLTYQGKIVDTPTQGRHSIVASSESLQFVSPKQGNLSIVANVVAADDLRAFFGRDPPAPFDKNHSTVEQNEAGVSLLFKNGKFHDVIELSDRLLTSQRLSALLPSRNIVQFFPDAAFRIRAHLFGALAFLGRYERLGKELMLIDSLGQSRFEDFAELFPGQTGSMIPFEIVLMKAEMPHFNGNSHEAIKRLMELYTSNEWKGAALNTIVLKLAHYFCLLSNFPAALDLLKNVSDVSLQYLRVRIMLQMGDFSAALQLAEELKSLNHPREAILISTLIAIYKQDYQSAFEQLSTSAEYFLNHSLYTFWLNNYATAALFSNNLSLAIILIEDYLRLDPFKASADLNLINTLNTMYTVASSRPDYRKKVVEKIVQIYGAERPEK